MDVCQRGSLAFCQFRMSSLWILVVLLHEADEVPFGLHELFLGVLLAHFYFEVDFLEFLDELV